MAARCLFERVVGRRLRTISARFSEQKRRRDLDPELLCRFEIDNQLELGGLHNRQVRGLFTLQDAANIDTCLPPCVRQVGTIADEATGNRVYAPVADRGDSVRESLRDMQASAVNPNRGSVLALALFGRRPPQRVERPVMPASKNLHNRRYRRLDLV
jgi:hypothetical protein